MVGWLVGKAVFSERALRIFLIFCMKLGDYKCRKVTAGFLKEKSWFGDICEKVSKLAQNQTLTFFSKTAQTIFLVWPEVSTRYDLQFEMKRIFQKKLGFRDIWPRNLQKIAQIEVFVHFLDFALLVFIDFPHNDTWAWCLVVFLQFVSPVNVFLLEIYSSFWDVDF